MLIPTLTASRSLYHSFHDYVTTLTPLRSTGGFPPSADVFPSLSSSLNQRPPGRFTWCSGTFTNLDTDPQNCGFCGRKCTADGACCGGNCVPLQLNCGGCGPDFACGPDERCCRTVDGDLECRDIASSVANCGNCDNLCSAFPTPVAGRRGLVGPCCQGGRCLQPDDFLTDARNCGDCGVACNTAQGEHCSRGHCCPNCTEWFDGIDTDLKDYGGLAGVLLAALREASRGILLAGPWRSTSAQVAFLATGSMS